VRSLALIITKRPDSDKIAEDGVDSLVDNTINDRGGNAGPAAARKWFSPEVLRSLEALS
jgi:hypothetical protein